MRSAMRIAITVLIGLLSCAAFEQRALAGITANGGFETGDFTNWTLTGNDVPGQLGNLYGVEGTDPFPLPGGTNPFEGNFQAFFSDQESDPITLSQTVPTVAGVQYVVSFYLAQEVEGPGTVNNSALVAFGSSTVASLTNLGPQGYSLYSDVVMATSSSTVLSFTFGNDIGEFLLDDVDVGSSTPEPSSWLFLLSGAAMFGLLLLRR